MQSILHAWPWSLAGVDVHDVGEYKLDEKERVFEPGMVLTIEPGLYISEDAKAPEQYKGIGIRIEDNLLVLKMAMKT